MRRVFLMLLALCSSVCVAQTVEINKDMCVRKLSDRAYLYTAWADVGSWGRVGSNGLILVDDGEAFLVDTPMDETQTVELADWLKYTLNARIVSFVPGHWHSDCVGGLDYLNKNSVESYAGYRTNEIMKTKGLPQAKHNLADTAILKLGAIDIECYYLGGGHATDNIVVWIPSEKILFGGCMLKDCDNDSLGNVSDASPLEEWLQTVCRIEELFPKAEIVIPGHGDVGGPDILRHTKEVLLKNIK